MKKRYGEKTPWVRVLLSLALFAGIALWMLFGVREAAVGAGGGEEQRGEMYPAVGRETLVADGEDSVAISLRSLAIHQIAV